MRAINDSRPAPLTKSKSADLQTIIDRLPALPSALRYYDDFLDRYHSIREPGTHDRWVIIHDGQRVKLNFDVFGPTYGHLLKHVFVVFLSRSDTSSVLTRFSQLRRSFNRFGYNILDALIGLEPHELRQVWVAEIISAVTTVEASALRAVLHAYCELNIGPWNPGLNHYVSQLPSPKTDIYKTVRTGDCFVPIDQQALIIDYFDELTALITASPGRVDTKELRDACVLLIIYQHAARPGQVARIKTPDVRVFNTGAVHYSVPLIKQVDQQKRRRVSRRVKRDWCPIVIEFYRRRSLGIDLPNGVPEDAFFGLTPKAVSKCSRSLISRITGEDWLAMDLRHSAAQRLADAGTAHIVLSEFMGHSTTKTASVYFDTSSTQAQRVNQALGLSPIYATVAEVARTRTIDKAALFNFPFDMQIGGVPHGIPIAGIGACAAGQSVCSKNPVLSCYTCRKFMPVNDPTIHREVTDDLRPVVLKFAEASRGNEESPAYTQLRRTLDGAERVIADIKSQQEIGDE